MKSSVSRWLILSVSLTVLAGGFWIAGDALRYAATLNLEKQRSYLAGVDFELSGDFDGARRPLAASVSIRRLYDVGFYRKQLVEPNAVKRLKEPIAEAVAGLYFPDEWQLLWYLEFTGNTNALYASIDHGLALGIFANSTGCTRFSACSVEEATSTVNSNSSERLLGLILDNFVTAAMTDFAHGANSLAKRRALDALQLIRGVNMDRNQSEPNYDRALVMASFMTRADAGTKDLSSETLRGLASLAGGGSTPVESSDPDISVYVEGITQLRAGCAWTASATFAQRAQETQHEPIAELFAFLAVRAVASPLIIRSMLSLDDAGAIVVGDCEDARPITEYAAQFQDLTAVGALPQITHEGLASDVLYYASLLPSSVDDMDILIQKIRSSENAEGSEEPEQPPATSDTPGSSRAISGPSEDQTETAPGLFAWPASGPVIVDFATSNGTGISIALADGTPVSASEDGRIIYTGNGVEGYGNLVLIRHPNGYVSAYGHLGSISVQMGNAIARGAQVGTAGSTGSVTEPQLAFELRNGDTPVDPMTLLSP